MPNMTMTYNFEDLFKRYAAKDIYSALQEGIMPGTFQINSRYDELLESDVLSFITHFSAFQEWRSTLKVEPETASLRINQGVPVIETGYNLSTSEVRRFRHDGKVMMNFMQSMANCLTNRALPNEEAFAVIMDALFTSNHVGGTNLENVH